MLNVSPPFVNVRGHAFSAVDAEAEVGAAAALVFACCFCVLGASGNCCAATAKKLIKDRRKNAATRRVN